MKKQRGEVLIVALMIITLMIFAIIFAVFSSIQTRTARINHLKESNCKVIGKEYGRQTRTIYQCPDGTMEIL